MLIILRINVLKVGLRSCISRVSRMPVLAVIGVFVIALIVAIMTSRRGRVRVPI